MNHWVRPEYRLLLAAAAVEPPDPPDPAILDWDEVSRLAIHHRIEGLLDAYVRHTRIEAPREFAERLRERRHRLAAAEMAARVQLRELSATLESAGIKSVPLKGAALLDSAYDQVGLRPLGDIDVLVSPELLMTAVDALVAAGYEERQTARPPRPGEKVREHHHHDPLRHPAKPYAVELHLRPTLTSSSEAATVLEGAYASPRGPYLLPDPSDHLVILAAHFIIDREIGSLVALAQLADIARVSEDARLDQVAVRAAGWGLSWETFAALDAVRTLGLGSLPERELGALRPPSWNRGTTEALIRHRVLVDSALSMTPRRSPPGLRRSLVPGRAYLRARYGMADASRTQLYAAHARALTRRARPLVVAALRHPRRSAAEVILARRLRAR